MTTTVDLSVDAQITVNVTDPNPAITVAANNPNVTVATDTPSLTVSSTPVVLSIGAGVAGPTGPSGPAGVVTTDAPLVLADGNLSITNATPSATGAFTSTQATKLQGIDSGATANETDAYLLARAHHTGTQLLSTISDAGTAAAAAATSFATAAQGATADTALQPGDVGTAAYAATGDFDPAGAAAAVTTMSIGAVPTARTVNGHALSANVTVTYSDVGADAAGAAASVTTTSIGAVPTSRTVAGHALSANVTITASDVGADASGSAAAAQAAAVQRANHTGYGYTDFASWELAGTAIAGSWATAGNNTGWRGGWITNNTGPAAGDAFQWALYIAAGTYTLNVFTTGQTTGPTYQLSIGGTNVGAQTATTTTHGILNRTPHTGVVVSASGQTTLRVTIANTGNTGTAIRFGGVILQRTA